MFYNETCYPTGRSRCFIPDSESRVLLIKRTDNGFWCTPGGSRFGETPEECGVREVLEETGFEITINRLLGVFSSLKYESVNIPGKEENTFTVSSW